jgi:hypothetical protein
MKIVIGFTLLILLLSGCTAIQDAEIDRVNAMRISGSGDNPITPGPLPNDPYIPYVPCIEAGSVS